MSSKLRLSRGPLRWWLMVLGVAFGQVNGPRFAVGQVLVLVGAALHVWAKAALWQNRQLSMDGPYRFTRNPFYLANLLIDGGLLLVIGRWELAMLMLPAWAWVYGQTICAEEAALRGLFGMAFDAYCQRVPRFWPRLGRYLRRDEVDGPRWTWSNVNLVTGREWTRVCRVLCCPWLLLLAAIARGQSPWSPTALPIALTAAVAAGFLTLGGLIPLATRRPPRVESA